MTAIAASISERGDCALKRAVASARYPSKPARPAGIVKMKVIKSKQAPRMTNSNLTVWVASPQDVNGLGPNSNISKRKSLSNGEVTLQQGRYTGSAIIGLVSNRQHAGPGSAAPDAPEPSLAERARTLAEIGRIGSLATHSRKFPGFPFCSTMPFAADDLGRPIFLISSMAMHTQNLRQDGRASLLITQPDVFGDPLGAARLTLVGVAGGVPAPEVRELYLARYENARSWENYTDFTYYRLEVDGVYFIGGFGVMGWVPAEDYISAAPDPLADAASGIIQHMNADHADALRRIANHAGEAADEASITSVDRLGFHVRLKTGDRVHGRRIAFPYEVRDTSAARAAFIEMVRACGAGEKTGR